MMNIFIGILIFLLGASIGSFLSVAITRIQKNQKGIVFGHSACPSCKKKLRSRDMIPIVSYLRLKGRCRFCKKPISPFYFYLEIIMGLVLLSLYLQFPFFAFTETEAFIYIYFLPPFIFYSIYATLLVAIFFYDLQTKRIPDVFLFPLLGIALLGTLVMGTPGLLDMVIAAIIALVFFGGQIAFSGGKWLGEGDLYLALALAVIFGWQLFLVSVVISYFVGAAISVALLITKEVKAKAAIPFAPFLVIGALVTIFFGNDILNWYLSTLML